MRPWTACSDYTTKNMTLTDEPTARTAFPEVAEWFDTLPEHISGSLVALGELLAGIAERPTKAQSADEFTARHLGVPHVGRLVDEERDLPSVAALTTGLALAEWIEEHAADTGPGEYTTPPAWTQTEVGETTYRHPRLLRAAFGAGTLLPDTACVIHLDARNTSLHPPQVSVWVRRDRQPDARAVLDRLIARAKELNPYRGRALPGVRRPRPGAGRDRPAGHTVAGHRRRR